MKRFASAPAGLPALAVALTKALVVAVTNPGVSHGRFAVAPEAPVDRLITNVRAHLAEQPKDARGYYVLARLHTLALSGASVRAYERAAELPNVDLPYAPVAQGQRPEWQPADPADKARKEPTPEQRAARAAHLRDALANYDKALELSPGTPLFLLGRAYAIECGADVATTPPPGAAAPQAEPAADAIRAAWLEAAAAAYLKAFRASIDADSKQETLGATGLRHVISHEAGEAFLRLAAEAGVPANPAAKQEVEKGLAVVRAIPRGKVTPIIFPLDAPRPLAGLVSDRPVTFDLDGDLHAERWSWVRPDTGILVWDPTGAGTITSGRQLFGSVTWWMFWTDGYRALDALDDDRDGELRGAELAGLAVWRDASGNGVSEPGEVLPLGRWGITGLAVRATTTVDGCPANSRGVRFRDGRILPSYDWIATPR